MAWHTLPDAAAVDVRKFESDAMAAIGLIPEIVPRYRCTYFSHIFSGGYSAGYYVYIWSEVLDCDAFEAFKEKGIFDRETAAVLPQEHPGAVRDRGAHGPVRALPGTGAGDRAASAESGVGQGIA